jgi:cytochrome c-type biogenesis protein CcmH/NrfG
MKRTRWAAWTLPAILCLPLSPAILNCQVNEHSITDRLILGNVVFAGDDQPAEQVDVELRTAAGTAVATTVTSWGGEFYFAQVDPGEYLLAVEKPGCEPLWEKVQVPLAARRVTLRLKRNYADEELTVSARELSIPPKARMALRDGVRLLQTDLPRGMDNLQRAIALFPGYYEAYYVLGIAELMMQRQSDAAGAFRQSIELSEYQYARPLMALGAVLCDQQNFVEAESVLREGLKLDDTPWIGHFLLARALFGLQRWDEAEETAQEAILRQPEVSDAYLLLAHIHMRQNNAAAVLEDLDQFLRLEPDGDLSAQAKRLREELWRRDLPRKNAEARP